MKGLWFETNNQVPQRTPHLNVKWHFLKSSKIRLQTSSDLNSFARYFSRRTALVVWTQVHQRFFIVNPPPNQWFLKKGFPMIQTLAMALDHFQPQAPISESGWYRQLMTSNTEKVVTGRIQLSTPAPVQGRGWEAHTWHKRVRTFLSYSCMTEVLWSGIWGLCGQIFTSLES